MTHYNALNFSLALLIFTAAIHYAGRISRPLFAPKKIIQTETLPTMPPHLILLKKPLESKV